MRQKWIFLLFCFLILFGCKIKGTISKDGIGMKGITVILKGDSESTAVTDSHGNYVFNPVKAGTYMVSIKLGEASFTKME